MGDSLGDLQMADGADCETLLTIGYLNHDIAQLEAAYMDAYDIVVTDDAPMDFVLALIQLLITH